MSMDFVNEYIASCFQTGRMSPAEIKEAAEKEILSLDEEIKKIEAIKNRQNNLRNVVRQLGGGEVNKRAKKAPMVVDPMLTESDLDPLVREICAKICDYIEVQHPKALKPREIMDAVSSLEENKIVLTAIKWLWDHGIIERKEDSLVREISKGKNWTDRPLQK
ncbi:MAG TPA: hypothetical protein VM577_21500 [Anaerovoracaceae bacterium]|nr:hypothetical protein [Anaerovoracaceae bacterium]